MASPDLILYAALLGLPLTVTAPLSINCWTAPRVTLCADKALTMKRSSRAELLSAVSVMIGSDKMFHPFAPPFREAIPYPELAVGVFEPVGSPASGTGLVVSLSSPNMVYASSITPPTMDMSATLNTGQK